MKIRFVWMNQIHIHINRLSIFKLFIEVNLKFLSSNTIFVNGNHAHIIHWNIFSKNMQ